jgi:processive 1,2-diacylglycerol beta-glucosyltransferase
MLWPDHETLRSLDALLVCSCLSRAPLTGQESFNGGIAKKKGYSPLCHDRDDLEAKPTECRGGRDIRVTRDAVLLTGPFGLGHEMLATSCGAQLRQSGWHTRDLDCMALLGSGLAQAGQRVFDRLLTLPGIYDGLHFAHLRQGSRTAELMDRAACSRLVPALRAELERQPAGLVLSVFATGASAAAKLKAESPRRATAVLCSDAAVHRLWVSAGTDLFLVTSHVAAASVRRYLPRAQVAIIPPPVRPGFYSAPSQQQARLALGVPAEAYCALVIDSGSGSAALPGFVRGLSQAGVHVLAVAGRHRKAERQFRELAMRSDHVTAFGFTDRVPQLMAASDLVVAMPGATTCSEARVVGRQLLLLDALPGHGRDNVQHELELGGAHVCVPTAAGVTRSALALRDLGRLAEPGPRAAERWEPAFVAALQRVGVDMTQPAAAPPARAGSLTVALSGASAQAGRPSGSGDVT